MSYLRQCNMSHLQAQLSETKAADMYPYAYMSVPQKVESHYKIMLEELNYRTFHIPVGAHSGFDFRDGSSAYIKG